MVIKKGDIIKVEYEGRFTDQSIFDSTEIQGGEPMKFKVGAGFLIQGFDKSVVGKEVGDEFTINLKASEAYGEIDPELIQTISRDQLPEDIDPEPGMMLSASDENGNQSMVWIKNVDGEFVTLDMNHPMAGKTLNFKIKILEIGCEPDPPHTHECGCGCDHN